MKDAIAQPILNRLADRLAAALAPPRSRLRPFEIEGQGVGHVDDARAALLDRFDDVFRVTDDAVRFAPRVAGFDSRSEALDGVARKLAAAGALTRWRDELYAVSPTFDSPPLCLLERAAARFFGIRTFAAHVNGTALREGATLMWIARRSDQKPIDPGMLDNLVGGGIASGSSVAATVEKEAWEEAGIAPAIARGARREGTVEIFREQPDGVQRETIFVHDLVLPPDFQPLNQDGEVQEFRLVTPALAAALCGQDAGDDVVTADASLVLADWLLRHGHVPRDSSVYGKLDALRRGGSA